MNMSDVVGDANQNVYTMTGIENLNTTEKMLLTAGEDGYIQIFNTTSLESIF